MRRFLLLASVFLAACTAVPSDPQTGSGSLSSSVASTTAVSSLPAVSVTLPKGAFGGSVNYTPPAVTIDPAVSKDFGVDEIQNMKDIEKSFGFSFTAAEKAFLAKNKFVTKNLLDTNLRPIVRDTSREIAGLYDKIRGKPDVKEREPANAVFYTADVFLNTYSVLFVELLKEMENTVFFPSMRELSKQFYEGSAKHLAEAKTAEEKAKWTKVRNYFAVPYAILSNAVEPPSRDAYSDANGVMLDPATVMNDYKAKDAKVDTEQTAIAFIKNLKLDAASEATVLADVHSIFAATGNGAPKTFEQEYKDYKTQTEIEFKVDWSQFTPRSHYTSSSLRRQYFRAMNWYIQVPFFLKSPALTQYAYAASQLLAEHPQQLADYARLESTIGFLVGTSDDLMPVDYLESLQTTKGQADQAKAAMDYLVKARNPKIKGLAATYPTVGGVQGSDVLLLTKGMRFFSGKFIIDSYWTGYLTQGDEAVRPGYSAKLPPMASSLEVMALLGSDYARTQIQKLDFYQPAVAKAIDKAMADLDAENKTLGDAYWQESIYSSALWTIKGLFGWQAQHKADLPRFMQSQPWEVKTLQTASGFWTEMRHAVLLYAKQSFAELGGGAPCDTRKIPAPPKGYIEPQPEAYARLQYAAKRTLAGLEEQRYELQNLDKLRGYVALLDTVNGFAKGQLKNTTYGEEIIEHRDADPDQPGGFCVWYELKDGKSDWEEIRNLAGDILDVLPLPAEGPVLSAKDKRVALVADVHTGGDSANPTRILYEAVGVPQLIFVAVKDINGPRLTTGVTYSHYEFTEPYGGPRKTDEQWQSVFYTGDDSYDPFAYTKPATWPKQPFWYDVLKAK